MRWPTLNFRLRIAYVSGRGPPLRQGNRMDETITAPRTTEEVKAARPKLHKVILLNDDYTPRGFVVRVLAPAALYKLAHPRREGPRHVARALRRRAGPREHAPKRQLHLSALECLDLGHAPPLEARSHNRELKSRCQYPVGISIAVLVGVQASATHGLGRRSVVLRPPRRLPVNAASAPFPSMRWPDSPAAGCCLSALRPARFRHRATNVGRKPA